MQIRNYDQVIRYLEGFIGKIIYKVDKGTLKHRDPLERMRVLLSLLGNPQNKFRSALVGGTSGKSSTSYLISHILKTAGYKTGLTLSPHIQKINERIQINGEEISDTDFTDLVKSVGKTVLQMEAMEVGAPSYFEIIIAMAFKYFADEKVDIAVVEVGMGGEYDATNTLYPLIAVITNVSLDHTNILGRTVEKIARTKAGIIKSGSTHSLNGSSKPSGNTRKVFENNSSATAAWFSNNGSKDTVKRSFREEYRPPIVVSGVKQPSVVKIVEDRCREVRAKLYLLGKDFDYKIKKESLGGSVFDVTFYDGRVEKLHNLKLSLLGGYQVANASLAIKTILQLKKFGFRVSKNDIRKALPNAFFPGRFEYLIHNTKYKILLDGAHNPTKIREFLKSLMKIFPKQKKIFVIGFKKDKNIKAMLRKIAKVADVLIVTEFKGKTDMSVSASAEAESIKYLVSSIRYRGEILVEPDSKKALDNALAIEQYNNSAIVVVTGSLYLVGEVKNML